MYEVDNGKECKQASHKTGRKTLHNLRHWFSKNSIKFHEITLFQSKLYQYTKTQILN